MRFSARSKVGILLALLTISTLIGAFMVTALSRGAPVSARSSGQTFHGKLGHATLKQFNHLKAKPGRHSNTSGKRHNLPAHLAKPINAGRTASKIHLGPGVDSTAVLGAKVKEGTVLQNFNGLSSLDSNILAGIDVLPPDQGLCAGHDSSITNNPNVEFELINLAVAEYDPSGNSQTSTLLPFGPVSLNVFFGEPGIPFLGGELTSDPRCLYDAATDTFFYTALASDLATESHFDIVVYNATSGAIAEYTVDTTDSANTNCPCLGDQPKIGVDHHAFYVSMDEFPLGFGAQNGAEVFVLSKSQLVNQVTTLFVSFNNITLGGIPVTSLQPSISITTTNTEFLVNSFPFLDGFQNINPIAHTLGFWTVTHDEAVTDGSFSEVTLTGNIIKSETYAFPVAAQSSGDGVFTSSFLNPDDDRMQQCMFVDGAVWCSLTTAVAINGDPVTRDGVAWFKIDASAGKVQKQGYVASAGNYLIYPAIAHTHEGSTTIVFTITSPNLDPSAAYVIRKSGQSKFGGIKVVAIGFDPSNSGSFRWGDYSAAALDINGKDLWMATEYIPPPADQGLGLTNHGTRVFEVSGDH
jgi:hypothetical protein